MNITYMSLKKKEMLSRALTASPIKDDPDSQ